jgi:hypothetical protein
VYEPGHLTGTLAIPVYRGITFERTFELKKEGSPLNLTGETVKLVIGNNVIVLEEGSGLTVNHSAGKIEVVMTPTQTEAEPANREPHFYITLTSSGKPACPFDGTMIFQEP